MKTNEGPFSINTSSISDLSNGSILEEFLSDRDIKSKPPTQHLYWFLLRPFFVWADKNNIDFYKIEYPQIHKFLDERKKLVGIGEVSINTKNQTINAITQFFEWFIDAKTEYGSPTRIELRERIYVMRKRCKKEDFSIGREGLEMSVLNGLLEYAYQKPKDFKIFYLLSYFGMRIGEWCRIVGGDDAEGYIIVKSEKPYPKNPYKERKLYYDEMTGEILRGGRGLLGKQSYVFKKCHRHRMFYDKLTPHIFRYTFASQMRRRVPTPKVLQYLMGHYSSALPDKYDTVYKSELKEVMTTSHYYNELPFVQTLQDRWAERAEKGPLPTF